MSDTYSTVTALRDAIVDVVNGLEDMGSVLTHYEPRKNKRELIEEYQAEVDGERELRGVIITPSQPFHSSVVAAAGPVFEDTFAFDVTLYRGAMADNDDRDATLERALDALDALRAQWDMTTYGVELFYVTCEMRAHGYGKVKGFGCWITTISVRYQVYDDGVTPT